MFGKSKFMHIDAASDEDFAAFQAGETDRSVAFCGQPIVRGLFFNRGGADRDAPMCEPCAIAAGWVWDEGTAAWYPPAEDGGDIEWDDDAALCT